jgi:hypothetical protein
MLRRGTDGFASPPKEVVLRIFVALKNHRHRPGSGFNSVLRENNVLYNAETVRSYWWPKQAS